MNPKIRLKETKRRLTIQSNHDDDDGNKYLQHDRLLALIPDWSMFLLKKRRLSSVKHSIIYP